MLGITILEDTQYVARYNKITDRGTILFPFDSSIETIECEDYNTWYDNVNKLPKYNIKSSNNIEILISNISNIECMDSSYGKPIQFEY